MSKENPALTVLAPFYGKMSAWSLHLSSGVEITIVDDYGAFQRGSGIVTVAIRLRSLPSLEREIRGWIDPWLRSLLAIWRRRWEPALDCDAGGGSDRHADMCILERAAVASGQIAIMLSCFRHNAGFAARDSGPRVATVSKEDFQQHELRSTGHGSVKVESGPRAFRQKFYAARTRCGEITTRHVHFICTWRHFRLRILCPHVRYAVLSRVSKEIFCVIQEAAGKLPAMSHPPAPSMLHC